MWDFKWPWLGVLIPTVLIFGSGTASLFFVFRHRMSGNEQLAYVGLMLTVAFTYLLAIVVPPGSPPKDYKPHENQWKIWCNKCQLYKPPRTHHCKKCNTCVLAMDHHCPWTNNCVGHKNTPHFMRFLFMVLGGTGYTLYLLWLRAFEFYEDRELPAYLINKTELAAVIVLILLLGFIFFAIVVLTLRCLIHIASGKTQIETWEMERIESQFHTERLWHQIRKNYKLVHGEELPRLTSWNANSQFAREEDLMDSEEEETEREPLEEQEERVSLIPGTFSPDDVVFPYDLGLIDNFINALGYPWSFIFPWGGPRGNGYEFETNDDDDQLNLPWPPDGGPSDFVPPEYTDDELRAIGDATFIRKYLDPRNKLSRNEWISDMGETLQDFGVDVEEEKEGELELKDLASASETTQETQN